MTPIEAFLHDIKYQINHKIQAGLPSEDLKDLVHLIDEKLQKLNRGRATPTIYSAHACERCHQRGTCLSVLCSLKCGGHYVSGNKLLCISCLKHEMCI